MALGATQKNVLRVVLTSGTCLLGIGIVTGLVVSRFTNRLVSISLLDTAQVDVLSGMVAVAVVVLVGLTACLVPAWRAARTHPMRALREN